MAITPKPKGSGVTFTPDANINGPYNYTRADIPIYKTPPAASAPGGPGSTPGPAPAPTPTTPTVKPPGGAGGGAGGNNGAVRPITGVNNPLNSSQFTGTPNPKMNVVNNIDSTQFTGTPNPRIVQNPSRVVGGDLRDAGGGVNRTPLDNVVLGGGIKPSSIPNMPKVPVRQTGTGMALGGAGVGNAPQTPLPPLGTPTPPPATGGLPVAPKPVNTIAPKPVARPTTASPALQTFNQNPSRVVGPPNVNAIKPTQRNAFATALARPPIR